MNKKLQQISTLDALQSSSTFLSTPSLVFSNPSLPVAKSSSTYSSSFPNCKSSSISFLAADSNQNLHLFNTTDSCANLPTPQPSVPAPSSRPACTPTRQPSTTTTPLQSPASTSTSSVAPVQPLASTACLVSTPSDPPTPRTPPPSSLCQMKISFRNFKDENDELKYVKQAKEMISYNRNVMHIPIGDIEEYNQHLSEKIQADCVSLVSSFHSDLKTFMSENVEQTFGQEFYLSINFKHD